MTRRHLANHDHTCECGQHHLLLLDFDPLLEAFEDKLKPIRAELRRMGRHMATVTEQLTAVNAKLDDIAADVLALKDALGTDQLSPEAQTALDSLVAKVEALDTEVGDADGSDTQPV